MVIYIFISKGPGVQVPICQILRQNSSHMESSLGPVHGLGPLGNVEASIIADKTAAV